MATRKSTTAGQHSFAQIPHANIQRSSFDRSCGLKTTFNAGLLIPFFVDEALPGDTMSLRLATFARMATPLHPTMDNIYMDTHFFFVPNRLVWDNWQRFNGEQDNPNDSTDFLVPIVNSQSGGWPIGSMGDYFGLPVSGSGVSQASALHFRAMNLIWNQWFRDENLQDSLPVNKGDGPDDEGDYVIQRRGKRHDYFSSSLPFPQKGPAVQLPLGDTAPIVPDEPNARPIFNFPAAGETFGLSSEAAGDNTQWDGAPGQTEAAEWLPGSIGLVTDLSTATAATVNELREAFAIQKLFERDARGGSRYTEILRSHFGVVSPDARLQRPEYLGGGSTRVNINTVAQTSESDLTGPDASPQGNLAGYAVASSTSHGFNKSFTEHGVIIGLVSVRADLNYQQGLDRMWSRRTRFDFYWPSLAHLGEQAVLNKEIFHTNDPEDNDVWGYQERFAEYRYKPSKITGDMRSSSSVSLDTWHLAQDFDSLPTLGSAFIEENPPIERIIAVPEEPQFLLDAYFQFKCARPMPMYGVPGQIDRF